MKITRYIEPQYLLEVEGNYYTLNETELRIYMLEVAKGEKPYVNVLVTNLNTNRTTLIQSNGYLFEDIIPELNTEVTLQHMKLNSSLAS